MRRGCRGDRGTGRAHPLDGAAGDSSSHDNYSRMPRGRGGRNPGNTRNGVHVEAPGNSGSFHKKGADGQGGNAGKAPEVDEACASVKLKKLMYRDNVETLFKLMTPSFGFAKRLQQGSTNNDMTDLLILAISRASTCTYQNSLVTDLASKVVDSRFWKDDVRQYLNSFVVGEKMLEPVICEAIVNTLRRFAALLPTKSLQSATLLLGPLSHIVQVDHSCYSRIREDFAWLQEEMNEIRKQIQNGVVQRDQERYVPWTVEESDDYRRMSVVPTCDDIRGEGDPFLRVNKIYNSYEDRRDYLDVQFRLLKEDLVRPLREGLAELLRNRKEGSGRRLKTNMKCYTNVRVVSMLCSQFGLMYKITFDVSRLRGVRWEAGKRLMLGSLVCLSADQFETMLIGTVADRDVNALCHGVTYLYLDNECDENTDIKFDQVYEMIESPAYYEPYKNVLNVLQNIKEDTALPFERYLLNKNIGEEVPPPKYLTDTVSYDFGSILLGATAPRRKEITPLDLTTWPTAEELGLDGSQYGALQTALTKEFVVIQGPPGTGKTFIGVKVVQLLIENNVTAELWDGPVLLVCYTNHALDQFLEDILKLFPEDATNGRIIRIGSKSRSENQQLQDCLLTNIKRNKNCIAYRNYPGPAVDPKKEMKELENKIMELSAFNELTESELLQPEALRPFTGKISFTDSRSLLRWIVDKKAIPGEPNLLDKQHSDAKDNAANDVEDLGDILETEDREENKENVKSAEEQFQSVVENLLKKNRIFIKAKDLTIKKGEKGDTKTFLELLKAAQGIRYRFRECLQASSDNLTTDDMWKLTLADRWRLYNHWTTCFMQQKGEYIKTLLKKHAEEKRKLDDILEETDYRLFMHAKIIAMTTTGAAKKSSLLERVKAKIVIVEEAAEVLEAHVVASLSQECEHLILIGDHQQLRPKPADYNLSKKFRLDVSLFEKVILNKMHCDRLAIQHRMRPEIAELLVPHIYKSLENHESVLRYENVANVFGNLFFVTHSEPENSADDNRSHSNDHEAAFLAQLCKYFLNIGYEPEQITVLTTYTGQLFRLKNFMPKTSFEGVRITPVDNFQGEENDIILLSLVRSNEENKIGFLKIANRVCVALSRARKGLYITGNAKLLADVSPLWRDILNTLRGNDRLVESLPLGCRKHPENVVHVKTAEDFGNVPTNGCLIPCDFRLACGHVCVKFCHELDEDHKLYKCKKPCLKLCANSLHPCRDLCFNECSECQQKVTRVLSRCGHEADMPCFMNESDYECKLPCKLLCPVDHPCQLKCYEECKCVVPVTRILSRCEHEAVMSCYLPEVEYECTQPCKKSCTAGHPCVKLCHEVCDRCLIPVEKTRPGCGHEATMPCYITHIAYASLWFLKNKCKLEVVVTRPCGHTTKVPCFLSKKMPDCLENCMKSCPFGHPCQKKCHEPCGDCKVKVKKTLPRCQHEASVVCHMPAEGYKCKISCDRACPAGHPCPERCHEKCRDCQVMVQKTLPQCQHVVLMPCYLDPGARRCDLPCEKTCHAGHKCRRKCGEDCGECSVKVKKILPKCNHSVMAECHVSADAVICPMPCEKRLECDHVCQEVCGSSSCTTKCKVETEKKLPCEHLAKILCHQDPETYTCRKTVNVKCNTGLPNHSFTVECCALRETERQGCPSTCRFTLECGHECLRKCLLCVGDGKHGQCSSICSKKFPLCVHKCDLRCGTDCRPCTRLSSYICYHSQQTDRLCSCSREPCLMPCEWKCPHYTCTVACGHPCNRPPCNRPCQKPLQCRHICSGLCGEPCIYTCRHCNRSEFSKLVWPDVSKLQNKPRFLQLQPCRHIVEVTQMDSLVVQTFRQPPCNIDRSCFISCPVCAEMVSFCPRYNKFIRMFELQRNAAKTLIQGSANVRKKFTDNVNSWRQANNLNQKLEAILPPTSTDGRFKLGTMNILAEIETLASGPRYLDFKQKYRRKLRNILTLLRQENPYAVNKCDLSVDIVEMYKLYMEIQILRLQVFIRGPSLRVLDKCQEYLERFESIEVSEITLASAWAMVEKLNSKLCGKLQPHIRKDGIEDYILHLHQFYDMDLESKFTSHWMCCTQGHVYSAVEVIPNDGIDNLCPFCHPLNGLLDFLQPTVTKYQVVTKIDVAEYLNTSTVLSTTVPSDVNQLSASDETRKGRGGDSAFVHKTWSSNQIFGETDGGKFGNVSGPREARRQDRFRGGFFRNATDFEEKTNLGGKQGVLENKSTAGGNFDRQNSPGNRGRWRGRGRGRGRDRGRGSWPLDGSNTRGGSHAGHREASACEVPQTNDTSSRPVQALFGSGHDAAAERFSDIADGWNNRGASGRPWKGKRGGWNDRNTASFWEDKVKFQLERNANAMERSIPTAWKESARGGRRSNDPDPNTSSANCNATTNKESFHKGTERQMHGGTDGTERFQRKKFRGRRSPFRR